ncbi:MAG: PD-(D/E)XK nuclease-like domain-containing protein [Saprospiraceae bacterium]|nr:PD-(D/E)XK nuclease-like domain-containing protein [Saprospiraceae bacterium]
MSIKPDEVFKTGLFPDMSIEQYHSTYGISRSGIMLFRKSPLHYWHHYFNKHKIEQEESAALSFGNALHTYLLEPDQFNNRYIVAPKVDRRTTVGKKVWEMFLVQTNGRSILTEEQMYLVSEMAYSVSKNEQAQQLILNAQYEKSLFWNEKTTGMLCKARPDIWHPNMIVDLKTTQDATSTAFRRSLYDYGYHIQAAMIQDGIYEVTGQVMENFIFLAIEKVPPFACAIYILNEESLSAGRDEFLRHLNTYKDCLKSGEWPGYPTRSISIPYFYLNSNGENQ